MGCFPYSVHVLVMWTMYRSFTVILSFVILANSLFSSSPQRITFVQLSGPPLLYIRYHDVSFGL